jgi:hypothetical protein
VLLAWTNAGSPEAGTLRLDPATAAGAGFPAGMRIADYRRPSWSRDGRIVYFGTHKREPVADAIKKSEDKVSDVEIWHTNDVRMFPSQKSAENQDLRATLLTAWRLHENKVVPIGTDLNEQAVHSREVATRRRSIASRTRGAGSSAARISTCTSST